MCVYVVGGRYLEVYLPLATAHGILRNPVNVGRKESRKSQWLSGVLMRLLTQTSPALGAFADHPSPLSHPHDSSHASAACPLRSAMSDSALCPQQGVRKCWLSDE